MVDMTCNADANLIQQTVLPTKIVHWSLGSNQKETPHIMNTKMDSNQRAWPVAGT